MFRQASRGTVAEDVISAAIHEGANNSVRFEKALQAGEIGLNLAYSVDAIEDRSERLAARSEVGQVLRNYLKNPNAEIINRIFALSREPMEESQVHELLVEFGAAFIPNKVIARVWEDGETQNYFNGSPQGTPRIDWVMGSLRRELEDYRFLSEDLKRRARETQRIPSSEGTVRSLVSKAASFIPHPERM